MRALVHDPAAPHGLRLGQAPDPTPEPGQVLVRVQATSLNFGEAAFLARPRAPGDVPVGMPREPSSRRRLTARVRRRQRRGHLRVGGRVGRTAGSRRRPACRAPHGLDPGAAAALPVAAVTALRAIRRLGAVIGRRVLITGASGASAGSRRSWPAAPAPMSSRWPVARARRGPARARRVRGRVRPRQADGADDAVLENVGGTC